ncbi:Metallo-dependent phosphatase-like protein, partial [Bombardia bombarda]
QKPLVPPMKYGTNARPPLKIMQTVIADLPAKHLPTYSPSAKSPKRLVIVGDVHGQLSALQSLLDKLSFSTPAGDHLILAGDMVTKGPDSVGVVDLAMRLGASAVRGNHEDRVLLVASRGSSDVVPTLANYTNTTAYGTIATADDRAKSVARALSAAQLTWLASRPIILRVGRLPSSSSPNTNTPPWNAGELFVVHAGLVPRVPLHQQDPWAVMNMRSLLYPFSDVRRKTVRKRLDARAKKEHDRLDAIAKEEHERHPELPKPPAGRDVAVPIEGRDGEPWSEVWNRVQNGIERDEDRKVVVYGHDARKGLQTGVRYAFGLDSGCGNGKQLSALVLEAGPDGVTHRIVQVDCA